MLTPQQLPPKPRAELLAAIKRAKADDAQAFVLVRSLRSQLISLDRHKRGRMASVTPVLKAMRQRALMPMLELLAVDSLGGRNMSASAWRAWQINLLEAVGSLRDRRSAAVLEAIATTVSGDPLVIQSAAAALGKIGTDRAAKTLIKLSHSGGQRGLAVLAGMGYCRRLAVVNRLAGALAAARDRHHAMVIARALGDVGSAWAWKTPVVAASGEGQAVRARAAAALVNGYVAFGFSSVRTRITQAVLVVDDATTSSLIQRAKAGTSGTLRKALETLEQRVANSPLRR